MSSDASDLAISCKGVGKRYRLGATASEGVGTFLKSRFRDPLGRRSGHKDFWAVRDVNLDVQRGEVVGLIGRNGAGKSTMLKLLSRITEPTTGTIDLWGRVGSLLEVGTGFHPELTGRENIFLNGSILGMSRQRIRDKFDEIVDFSGVEKFLDTPVKRYSSGMFVRLAFSVAAHLEPEVLVVDEVLAVGDVLFQKKCLGKMKDAAGGGRTVLFVSHQIAAVRSLCTRAVLMQQGQVAMDGPVDEVAQAYARAFLPAESEAIVQPTVSPGADRPIATEVRLLADGRPAVQIDAGTPLSIEVDFESDRAIRPSLGVIIANGDGIAVLHTSSRYAPADALQTPRQRGTIRYDFGPIPLTGGDYAVSIYLGDADRDTHRLPEVLRFELTERDLFDAGKPYPRDGSLLWWPVETSVREPSASPSANAA
ncbi:MAG: ABC transporter ATP-binding protein [Planctomycetota bacterium]